MTNIALIVLDTLRKDRFDEYFEWIPGLRFENVYSTANWTAPSHASMFSGHYGSEIGVDAKSPALPDEPLLPRQLQKSGYTTRALSANHVAAAEHKFDQGFDEFIGPTQILGGDTNIFDWEKFQSNHSEISDVKKYAIGVWKCLVDDCSTLPSLRAGFLISQNKENKIGQDDSGAKSVLKTIQDTKFGKDEFLFVNLMEAHSPYDPPESYKTGNSQRVTIKNTFTGVSEPEEVRAAYDQSVKYLSDIYREIHEELSQTFDFIITVADHGECLGENGYWGHAYGLFPEITHVPLVISGNGLDGTVETPASLIDVYQTILDLADISGDSRGQSLLNGPEIIPRLAEYRGLLPFAQQSLKQLDLSDNKIRRHNNHLYAVIDSSGYGYERMDGYVGHAEQKHIDDIRNDLKEYNPKADTDVSDEMLGHLEDLGYM